MRWLRFCLEISTQALGSHKPGLFPVAQCTHQVLFLPQPITRLLDLARVFGVVSVCVCVCVCVCVRVRACAQATRGTKSFKLLAPLPRLVRTATTLPYFRLGVSLLLRLQQISTLRTPDLPLVRAPAYSWSELHRVQLFGPERVFISWTDCRSEYDRAGHRTCHQYGANGWCRHGPTLRKGPAHQRSQPQPANTCGLHQS